MPSATMWRVGCLLALCFTLSSGVPLQTPTSVELDDRTVINIYINTPEKTVDSPAACGLPGLAPTSTGNTLPVHATTGIDYTPTSTETPVYTAKGSPKAQETSVLQPAVHWDIDLNDHNHLQARMSIELFYIAPEGVANIVRREEPADVAVGFVSVPELSYPAVQLEHTNYVSAMACSDGTATVTFNDFKAFEIAKSDWPKQTAGVVLITTSPTCSLGKSGEIRHYVLISDIETDDSTMIVRGSIKRLEFTEAVGAENPIDVKFGNFSPNGKKGFDSSTIPGPGDNSTAGHPTTPSGNSTRLVVPDDEFDGNLDEQIGTLNLNDPSNLNDLFHGLNVTGESNSTNLHRRSTANSRRLARRWSIGNFFHDVVDTVKDIIHDVGHAIDKAKDWIEDRIDGLLRHTKDADYNFSYDSLGKGSTVVTPWGSRGYSIYQTASGANHLGVYCVGCGFNGQLTLHGHFVFTLLHGFTEGTISAKGNLQGTLQLGIDASYSTTIPLYDQRLADIPITWLAIPGIITVGPEFYVDAASEIILQAEGQVLVGGVLNWPVIDATIDAVNRERSDLGTLGSPNINPVLDIKGNVQVAADAYLKVALTFGINILSGAWKKQAALIDKPGFSISAGVSGSATIVNGEVTHQIGNAACPGINLDLSFSNELYAEENIIGHKNFAINNFKKSLWNKCFPLGPPPAPLPPSKPIIKPSTLWISPLKEPPLKFRPIMHGPTRQMIPRYPIPHGQILPRVVNLTQENPDLVQITTPDKNGTIVAAANGNMYAMPSALIASDPSATSASLFTQDEDENLIYSDAAGRVIFGYADTMQSMGVSRLRLGAVDAVPKSATLVAFVPAPPSNSSSAPSYLTIVDTIGGVYFPVACLYTNAADGTKSAKLFLSNDTISGPKRLESKEKDVMEGITGGGVDTCGVFGLVVG